MHDAGVFLPEYVAKKILPKDPFQVLDQEGVGQCMDLEQALSQLNTEDRMVVWLHDVEGYKHLEIAELVGKTESYSKTRLNRARAKLRALISANDSPRVPGLTPGTTSNATA